MARKKKIRDLIEKCEKTYEEGTTKQLSIRPKSSRGKSIEEKAASYEKVVRIFSILSEPNENPTQWIPRVVEEWHKHGLVPRVKENIDIKNFFKHMSNYRKNLRLAIEKLKNKQTA